VKRLLLVGVGRMGAPYVTAAHELGFAVSVADLPRRLARLRLAAGDSPRPVETDALEAWYSTARAAAAEAPPDAVVAFTEQHVVPAALVADELGLPGVGLRAALVSRNKALQRELFARHGIPQPAFRVVFDRAAPEASVYPLVVKPLDRSGSSGVAVVDSPEALAAAAAELEPPFLVEEYLDGPERSCEALVAGGEVVFASLTEKILTPPPECVELGHVVPAPEDAAAVRALAQDVVSALGMRAGIVHLEVKLCAEGPRVVEVAVRSPGDHIMELVRLATAVDLFAGVVAVAAGQRPDLAPSRRGHAAVWFPAPAPGVVTELEGLDALAALPGFHAHTIHVAVGSTVPPLRSSGDRIGAVLVSADSREELEERLALARSTLRIEVRGSRRSRAAGRAPPAA
jgi:biotin carboxylase